MFRTSFEIPLGADIPTVVAYVHIATFRAEGLSLVGIFLYICLLHSFVMFDVLNTYTVNSYSTVSFKTA